MTTESKPIFRRPESVLVLVIGGVKVLILERCQPRGFWQSVTGSLEWGESARAAAARELGEETGLAATGLEDLKVTQEFTILPEFQHRFAPGVTRNVEHVFRLRLAEPVPIRLAPSEHCAYQWVCRDRALRLMPSWSNRAALQHFF